MRRRNGYLQKKYLPDHNRRFSCPAAKPEDYHGRKPRQRQLREIFRLETERSISNDWEGRWLQLRPNLRRYGPTKSKALVCEWEDGSKELYYRGERIDYTELPELPKKTPSPATPAGRARVVRKAKPDHPWRQSYKAIPTWPNRGTAAPLVGMRTSASP